MMEVRKGKVLLTLWISTMTMSLLAMAASREKHSMSKANKRQQLGFRPVHFAAVGLPLGDRASRGGGSKTGSFKIDDAGVVGAGTYEIEPDGVDIDLSLKISANGQSKPVTGEPGAGGGPAAGGGPGAGGVPGAGGSPTPTVAPKPALCPVPCSQTKPTQGPGGGGGGGVTVPGSPVGPSAATTPGGGGAVATTAPTVPSGAGGTTVPTQPGGGAIPSQGPGASPSQGPGGSAPQPTPGGGAPTTPPASGGGGGGSAFEQQGLKEHNKYRQRHGVPLMKLNAEMSQAAAAYAQQIAQMGQLRHANRQERNNDGENLSMGCDQDGQTAAEATTNWYNEVCNPGYTFGQPNGRSGTGHFTQVVWKESVELGIGKYDTDKDGMKCTYIVGRYRPAGNMMGDHAQNVPQGSFNKARDCAGVRKDTILKYLATRSKVHHGKHSG